MKNLIALTLLVAAIATPAFAQRSRRSSSSSSTRSSYSYRAPRPVYVKPTVTRAGSYVPGHYRTSPNKTKADNWSTLGNVNPFTGKPGDKLP